MPAPLGSKRRTSLSPIAQSYAWLSPASRTIFLWKSIYTFCFLFELWAIPFELFFWTAGLPSWTDSTDLVFLAVFTIDIFLNLRIGQMSKSVLHMKWSHVAIPCIRSWLWLDVFATVPYIVCITSSVADIDVKFLRYVPLLRVFRLRRVEELGTLMAVFLRFTRSWLPLLKFMFVSLFLAHIFAILLAVFQPEQWVQGHPDGAYGCYWQSLRLSVLALTLGSTSASSHRDYQILWDLLVSVARLVLLLLMLDWSKAYSLVKFSSTFRNSHARKEPSYNELLAYLDSRAVQQSLQIRILQALNESQNVRKDMSRIKWLKDQDIEVDLRYELTRSLWEKKIRTLGIMVPLVQWCNSFAAELAVYVDEVVLATGGILFSRGDPMLTAYFILKGTLAVLEDPTSGPRSPDYTESMWVGEHALVNPDLVHTETVLPRSPTELMAIHASDFRSLLAKHHLLEKYEHFLLQKFWMGFCDRCGVFGDHFSRDCPLVESQLESENSRFSREMAQGDREELSKLLEIHGLRNMSAHLKRHSIKGMNDLNTPAFDDFLEDEDARVPREDKTKLRKIVEKLKRKAVESTTALMRTNTVGDHYIFISHYKIEAGTEATLIRRELEVLLVEAGGHPCNIAASPIFVDSESLTCLTDLQSIIVGSQNVVLLLTPGVLTRPWVLIELALAYRHEINVIPVEIQRPNLKFKYPDEAYLKGVRTGKSLSAECLEVLRSEGIKLVELERALRQLFKLIAVPYSPHKSESIRDAELQDLLKRCTKLSAFKSGDKVLITKESRTRGKSAVVTDPDWHGLVKVAMEDDDEKGIVKSYKPDDIALVGDAPGKIFKVGDQVRIRKESRTKGKTAMIVDANWNGLVKVNMYEADPKGTTKSFDPVDLELLQVNSVEV